MVDEQPDTPSVIVVGSINTDLVVSASQLPSAGETVVGVGPSAHQGGKGANAAVASARLGARVSLVAAVGEDGHGHAALEDLRGEGVDTTRVAVLPGEATGVALIVVDPSGENLIAVGTGANRALSGAHVESALHELLDAHATSQGRPPQTVALIINLEIPDEAVAAAVASGIAQGLTVILDPAPARKSILGLDLRGVILTPNAGEAALLTGSDDPVQAGRRLSELTRTTVIITQGARGALIVSPHDRSPTEVPPPAEVDVVDATGAGDTFVAAFAAQSSLGADPVKAVRFAVAAATRSTSAAGARAAMPRWSDVDLISG